MIHLYGEEWENGNWVPANEPLRIRHPDGILFGYEAQEMFLYYSEPTGVGNDHNIADQFNLFQNYPNPFNPTTKIKYSVAVETHVRLAIFNILGQEVIKLKNEVQKPGYYEVTFDASSLSSGIYLYTLQTDKFTSTKKMMVLK